MRKLNSWLIAPVSALVMSACAVEPPGGIAVVPPVQKRLLNTALECKDDGLPCDVDVVATVVNGGCVLTLPDRIEVHGVGRGDRKLRWILNPPPQWEFQFDDIEIPLDPNHNVFRVIGRGKVLSVTNRRLAPQTYPYTLKVSFRPAGGSSFTSCGKDPVIVNMG